MEETESSRENLKGSIWTGGERGARGLPRTEERKTRGERGGGVRHAKCVCEFAKEVDNRDGKE